MSRFARVVPVLPLVALTAVTLVLAYARSVRPTGAVYNQELGLVPTELPLLPTPSATGSASTASFGALARSLQPAADGRTEPGPHQLHGSPRRTHRAAAHGPLSAQVAWATVVGGAVAGQVTVSRDGKSLYAATLAGELVALNAATGAIQWRADLAGRVYGTPTVLENGNIVVGSDAKTLFAFSSEGKSQWTFKTEGEADTAPLLLRDGSMVVAAGKQLVALSASGNVIYRLKVGRKVYTAPAELSNGVVVFGAQDDHVYGVDREGRIAFRTSAGGDVDGSPVATDDGAFFVGNDAGEVLKLDAAGVVMWKVRVGGFVRGALALSHNGDVLVGHYGPAPRVVRLRGADGHLEAALAVQGTGAKEFGVHGGPLEDADGALYFGAQDDYVTALNPDGTLRFRWNAGADVDAPLTLLGSGRLIVASDSGTITAIGP